MMRLLIVFFVFTTATCNEDNWWKFTEIYEVYISSFKDSNGDGVGDLKGLISKLDHFVDLQIDSIWITPFYDSPKNDNGYDISNYTAVDPVFGTLADFEELSKQATKRGIKIIIDFVINHSSDEHIWFQKSIEKIKPYDDYYIWKDPKGYDKNNNPIPPNNWLSWFDGSAWEWNAKRKQFYLHQFGKKQPDLNLRNEKVIKDLKDVLVFWFDRGVSGLRFDAAAYYIEDAEFRNESRVDLGNNTKLEFERDAYTHKYTKNLPESYELIHEFRVFIDKFNKKRGGNRRIIVVEDYADLKSTLAYYGTEDHPVAHYPFNFELARASDFFTSASLHQLLTTWLESLPKFGVPAWNAENHDRSRIGSRFGKEYTRLINILIMLLPGVPSIYYGQEICMVDGVVRPDQEKDYVLLPGTSRTRDIVRTPMQWDRTLHSGFTSGVKTWLPVQPSFWRLNVGIEKNKKNNCLNIFKDLSRLRKTRTCKYGTFNSFQLSTWLYAFTRNLKEHDTYIVVMNLGTDYQMANLQGRIPNLKTFLKVLVATENSGYNKGDTIKVKSKFPPVFVMRPLSAIVFLNGLSSKVNG